MNKITLIGNVGQNAQSAETKNGGMVTFSLGVSESRKNEQGEWETTRTDWFSCAIYVQKKETADHMATIITAGSKLAVVGKMQSREYEKDGQKHTGWNVKVEEFEVLSQKKAQ